MSQMSFARFADELDKALAASKEAASKVADKSASLSGQRMGPSWGRNREQHEVDMSGVFDSLKDLRQFVGVSKAVREVFRPYFVTAVFRAIVHDAKVNIDEDDGTLKGVTFAGEEITVEQ